VSDKWWNEDDLPEDVRSDAPPPSGGYQPPLPKEPPRLSHGQPDMATTSPSAMPAQRGVPIGLAIAAVLALIGGLLVYGSVAGSDERVASGEIYLERADEAGEDPFFDAYATLVSFDPTEVTPPGAQPVAETAGTGEAVEPEGPLSNAEILALTFNGSEPGLYGGTGNNATCNKAALIAFLETNQEKADAWAAAQGIQSAEIREFVDGLTTVVLLADTRVTNHGFKNGTANPIQSVLQAGTAVMIDAVGTPRVKCGCGNPLDRPVAQSRTVVLKGEPWEDFDQEMVATIEPSSTLVDTFVLRSTDTGEAIERPAGTAGEADVISSLAAPRPTDDLAAGASAAVAGRWYEFVLGAIADLRSSSPPELSGDWTVVADTYARNGAEGSFDLYNSLPGLADAEDRIVLHAEDVCGLDA